MEPSRRRHLLQPASSSRTKNSNNSNAYRLQFSVEHIGKYRSNTKRRIKWRFGFTNLQAAREGKIGVDCRGEEHEVVLVWSVKSGKTRVFWNKSNISHLFRDKRNTETVDICWESRSGEKFQISAHESPTRFCPQYDFLIDGVSIFSVAHLSELTPAVSVETPADAEVRSESSPDTRSEGACSMDYDTFDETLDVGFRLSMAGFSPSCEPSDDLMDDLTSSTFTNLLESLRRRVTSLIPNSEDMVSRAIVNAFSDDRCESSSCSNSMGSSYSLDSAAQTAMQIEAEVVCETTEWINLNVQFAPRPDVEEQKRDFLQKQMDTVFMHAHHERLTENEVARILSDVAMLLGVPVLSVVPKDTLILNDLDMETNSETLSTSLMVYGELQEVGMANSHRFAICRFATERGPVRALAAAEQGTLLINGRLPRVSLIEKPLLSERPDLVGRRAVSTPAISKVPIQKPILARRKSHQRNTIQIETLISETPFLRLVNDTSPVSPMESSSFIKPNDFEKMMGTTHHFPVFNDAVPVSPSNDRPTFSHH